MGIADPVPAAEVAAPGGEAVDAGLPGDMATPDGGASQGGLDGGSLPDAGLPAARDYGTDRARFFGATRCAQAGLLLCEDFEGETLDAATWTRSGNGSVSIASDEHARGQRALRVQVSGSGGAFITEKRTFPAAGNTYFGRAFVKFVQMPRPPMTFSHWTVIAATGTQVAGEIRVGGFLTSGKQLFGVGTDNRSQEFGTGDWTTIDKDPDKQPRSIPLNEWVCIEWLHQGATNETRFWWDAVEHPSLHTTETLHGGNANPYVLPQFTALKLGWAEYQASDLPFELWLDEVAVDSARIGCVL